MKNLAAQNNDSIKPMNKIQPVKMMKSNPQQAILEKISEEGEEKFTKKEIGAVLCVLGLPPLNPHMFTVFITC